MCPDPDPLPGDFDEELRDLDPADVQVVGSSRSRRLVVRSQAIDEGPPLAGTRRTAIVATSHPVRSVVVTKQALQQMVDHINDQGLPSYFEHDSTRPPIGRAYAARLKKLADDEWAVVVDFEFYDEGYRALIVQRGAPPLIDLAPITPEARPFELELEELNWDVGDIDQLVRAVEDVGGVVAPDLIRRSAVPDPILVFSLGTAATAGFWFSKGFFTKVGDRLGEAVGDDLVAGYLELRQRIIETLTRRKPPDRPPILVFSFDLDDEGHDVLIEGSSRDDEPERVERFLDAGESLVFLARTLLPTLPNRHEITKLHFRYDADRDCWILEYGLAAGAEAFLFVQQGQVVIEDEPATRNGGD